MITARTARRRWAWKPFLIYDALKRARPWAMRAARERGVSGFAGERFSGERMDAVARGIHSAVIREASALALKSFAHPAG
mgnify:CR=1 FL=1